MEDPAIDGKSCGLKSKLDLANIVKMGTVKRAKSLANIIVRFGENRFEARVSLSSRLLATSLLFATIFAVPPNI